MAELNFSLDPQTRTFINTYSNLLPNAAPERIQSELQRIVYLKEADDVIDLLNEIGLLELWRNENMSPQKILFTSNSHKLLNDKELSLALPLIRLTHLLSDAGLASLRFSKRQRKRCQLLRKWQERNDGFAFETLKEEDRFQLHKDLEEYLPALILQLSVKDQEVWINRWRDQQDPLFHPSPPVDGNTLQEILHLPPGPKLGSLMHYLSHERAFGRMWNLEKILQEARHWWQHN